MKESKLEKAAAEQIKTVCDQPAFCVLFGDEKRNYIISNKSPMRPTFEDDK